MSDGAMSEAVTRRSFATAAALSFAGVGAGVSLWPLLATLAPNPASPGPDVASVDLARVQAGDTLRVAWRGLPVLVRHRTPAEIERCARLLATTLGEGRVLAQS